MSEHRHIVYCISTKGESIDLDCDVSQAVPIMLRSLLAHCDCKVVMLTDDPAMTYDGMVETIPLPEGEVPQLMQAGIHHLANYPFIDGDEVVVMDVDVIVQGDVFDAFDLCKFDVAVTKRHYPYIPEINAGVWCFRYSPSIKAFLDLFDEWMHDPANARADNDRWSDQDFLYLVYKRCSSTVPKNLSKPLIGLILNHTYNYCPADDVFGCRGAELQFRAAAGDPKYKVLHFKGIEYTKRVMIDIAREQGWI